LLIDTEGLFQPVEGVDPEFVKQVLLDQVIRCADMIILVVDRINIAEIEILKELRAALENSRILKKIMVVHNLKSIKTKDELQEYISELPDALGLQTDPHSLVRKSMNPKHNSEEVVRIDHVFLKLIEDLLVPDPDTREQIRYILKNIPDYSGVDFNDQLKRALTTITSKYYQTANKDLNLVNMSGPNDNPDGSLKSEKVSIISKQKGEMKSKELQCEVVYKFSNELKNKYSVQNWSYWEQTPIKFNIGSVYKEKDFYYLQVELECAGLDQKIKLNFNDDSTICVSGKKRSINQQQTRDVVQILKVRHPVALQSADIEWLESRIHTNENRNIEMHIRLNVQKFEGAISKDEKDKKDEKKSKDEKDKKDEKKNQKDDENNHKDENNPEENNHKNKNNREQRISKESNNTENNTENNNKTSQEEQ